MRSNRFMLATPEVPTLDLNVYEPAEDSFLLLDCLEQDQHYLKLHLNTSVPIVSEIGAGSGIVIAFIKRHLYPWGIYIPTDVNPHACQAVLATLKKNSDGAPLIYDVCQMDCTTAIRSQCLDLLVFNPPYVPAESVPATPNTLDDETWLDLALLGGDDGMEVTWRVLKNLKSILAPNGIAYILFCARNKPKEVCLYMRSQGWLAEEIITRKAGWEVLTVVRFERDEK